ncbi:class I SAM-dependent methyltransferase, partial [Mycobacterium tuberculosis]
GGFDAAEPAAWIAEGLFGYLPPDAQNRLLDHVTDLSAPGSRLALEAFLGSADRDSARVEEMIRTATRGWREHGFHLDIWALNYAGPRHEVSGYLDNHGWRSVGTTTAQLLAAHDLPAAPALPAGLADRPNYWTCVLG